MLVVVWAVMGMVVGMVVGMVGMCAVTSMTMTMCLPGCVRSMLSIPRRVGVFCCLSSSIAIALALLLCHASAHLTQLCRAVARQEALHGRKVWRRGQSGHGLCECAPRLQRGARYLLQQWWLHTLHSCSHLCRCCLLLHQPLHELRQLTIQLGVANRLSHHGAGAQTHDTSRATASRVAATHGAPPPARRLRVRCLRVRLTPKAARGAEARRWRQHVDALQPVTPQRGCRRAATSHGSVVGQPSVSPRAPRTGCGCSLLQLLLSLPTNVLCMPGREGSQASKRSTTTRTTQSECCEAKCQPLPTENSLFGKLVEALKQCVVLLPGPGMGLR